MSTFTIRCYLCRRTVPNTHAHVVKTTTNSSGRAWRCERCGAAENAAIRESNVRRLAESQP